MGIDRKHDAVAAIGADVLVVPECREAPALASQPGVSFAWKGQYPRKGLGVFGFGGWTVEPVEARVELPWVLPLRLIDPSGEEAALLLAIWTVVNKMNGRPSYAAQVSAAITAWEEELRGGRTVLAGDFNCSTEGPSSVPHKLNVQRLEALGVRSAFHTHNGVEHGQEQAMTLRWFGTGRRLYTYHCDFVFCSAKLSSRLAGAEVGEMSTWVESGLSDHAPVVVDLV